MSASAAENVLSLLARMGFDRGLLAHQPEIKIDHFDYWANPENLTLALTMPCSTVMLDAGIVAR